MKLGNLVEIITTYTGIKWLVKKYGGKIVVVMKGKNH